MGNFKKRIMSFIMAVTFILTSFVYPDPAYASSSVKVEANAQLDDDVDLYANSEDINNALMAKKKVVIIIYEYSKTGCNKYLTTLKKETAKRNGQGVYFKTSSPKALGKEWDWPGVRYQYTISVSQAKQYVKAVQSAEKKKEDAVKAISESSEEMAAEIHDTLCNGKSYTFYVYKDKQSAVIKGLRAVCQRLNNQAVIFQYDKKKYTSNVNKITITEAEAELYYYSIKLSELILKQAKEAGYEYIQHEAMMLNGCNYCPVNTGWEAAGEMLFPIIQKASGMYELSDPMKVYTLAISCLFDEYAENIAEGLVHVSYSHEELSDHYINYAEDKNGNKIKDTRAANMKWIYSGDARGICMSYAKWEQLLFSQWGIKAYYNSSVGLDHAWSVVKVKNNSGKTLWIPFDYGIGPSNRLAGINYTDIKYNTEAKLYKIYLADAGKLDILIGNGLSGAPNYKNWTWSDLAN